jgi:nucleotide-binding universal stress UspA family protein
MEFKRILVAVTSPTGPDAAFERALALAKSAGAELYLLHAVSMKQPFSFRGADRLERLADLRQRAEDAGVRVRTVEQHGDAADIIGLHANARRVDLIVMGTEATASWGHTRSSVVATVLHRTNVPTLVVASAAAYSATTFRNVLVAVDLSPDSRAVVSAAIALTRPEAEQLTVMHSVKGLEAAEAVQSPARWKVPEFRTHVLGDARRTLEGLVSGSPARMNAQVHVSSGSAARTILEHAADVGADLVVVGRSRGFKLLGSTALRIFRKNERALLVIPTAAHRTQPIARPRAA